MTQIRLIKANKIQTWDLGLSQWLILRLAFHLCWIGGVSKREAPDSTDTSCSTRGGACLRVGETPRRQLRQRQRLGPSLSCAPWSVSRVRSLPPLSAVTHICCDAVAVTGKLTIFIGFSLLFSIFLSPECLLEKSVNHDIFLEL